jgi:metal-responsive CopG/Arc/MetJ family transcriptional regulator
MKSKKRKYRYKTVSIPETLSEKIEPHLEELGYRTLSEFVIDTARRKLEQLERPLEMHA